MHWHPFGLPADEVMVVVLNAFAHPALYAMWLREKWKTFSNAKSTKLVLARRD